MHIKIIHNIHDYPQSTNHSRNLKKLQQNIRIIVHKIKKKKSQIHRPPPDRAPAPGLPHLPGHCLSRCRGYSLMHRRTRILLRLRGHICLRCPPPRAPPWPHPAHRLPSGRGEGDAGRCLPPAAQVKELKSGSGGEGRGGGVEEVEEKIRGRSLLLRVRK